MKAVILAAGIASRLRPLTDTMPKCLLQIGERCLLQRTFDALIKNGIHDFVVVTGYRHNQIEEFLKEHYCEQQIAFIYNEVFDKTNNIYSLWLAKPEVEGQEFLLLDSDILFDPAILARLLNAQDENVLALNNHSLGEEEIKVIVDEAGRVKELSKVCSIPDAIGESVGIERMSAAYSSALYAELQQMIEKEGLDNVFYELAFERLIAQGHTFGVVDVTDLFSVELDTVEDFQQAKMLIPASLF